jgi:short-subunit dehydrogenase
MPSGAIEKAVIFGATSAMAQEIVRLLAARGAELVLVGRNAARLESVASDARVRGARAVATAAADLDEHDRHPALLDAAFATLHRVDLVLVAQGVMADSDACEASAATAERVLLSAFVGPALLLQAAGLRLAAQGSGCLVGISSVAGDRGRQSNYAYGSAKAGLSTFLAGLRNRLYRRGVHVMTVKPGFVDTPMTAGVRKNALFVPPSVVARSVLRGLERRRDVVYVPGFWRWIMLAIRYLPEPVFKRLAL